MTDNLNDSVFFSSLLKADYPKEYQAIIDILDANHVHHALLTGTKDYWCRDYMPIQCENNRLVQFRYHPDYLSNKRKYETSSETVTRLASKYATMPVQSGIIADGGNLVHCIAKDGSHALIMTEKLLHDNKNKSKEEIISELQGLFPSISHFILLPWDADDTYGHVDGMLHGISQGRLLINLSVYPRTTARKIRQILSDYFALVDLKLSEYDEDSWAYINMLHTRKVILIPALGLKTDREAFEQIRSLFPEYENRIYSVNIADIVRTWGGALNCLSWTIQANAQNP